MSTNKLKHLLFVLQIVIFSFCGISSAFAQNTAKKGLSENNLKIYTTLEMALQYPDSVKYLSLKHKKYKVVPPEVFQFKNLEILDLSKNKLHELPEQIEQLVNLRELNVSNNNLTTFPIQIGNLVALQKILAFQNNIALLPSTMENLKELTVLDLWSNEIEQFPEEMIALKKLKLVDLRGIMLTDEQKAAIKKTVPQADVQFSMGCNCIK